ncbi:MAG: formylmethanofuran dehydrogenase subunit A [Euryarchaeota archaeon]|nr:formylmethanofuran dehydrogenase subunit A [Euryarchaeota archaeon]
MSLILKNGIVYDPRNGMKGEKKDIFIENGKVVEKLRDRKAQVIDVSNKLVMPGGVEIHSHIAGGKVNVGRMLRPEDRLKLIMPRTPLTRSGAGFANPTAFMTGYLYSKMGYTTTFTPAMPPLMAKHTHEELHDIPMTDKGAYALTDGNWFIYKYLKEGDIDKCAAYVAWLLKATRGLAIKVVNPGGTEAWGWGKNCTSLDDPVPNFDITPREIIRGLMEVNERLGLPHSIHLHTTNLGRLGNYVTTLETLKIPNGTKAAFDRQVMHLTHLQFHCFGGDTWKNFESKADEVVKEVNKRENVAIDSGNVTLDETTTMTADGPMEYYLQSLSHLKWVNKNVEMETAPGVTPFIYSNKMSSSSIQWAIGLEVELLVKDPWKIMLTTDHPNGGPFFRYPRIIAWLMSRKYREKTMAEVHKAVQDHTILPTLDREYTLDEIATITRAAPARAFGPLAETKGHLGVGADGDVSVYDIDPRAFNPNDYLEIEERFSKAAYTVKGGEVVVKDGEIVKVVQGRTLWSSPPVNEALAREVMKDIEYSFKRYYSVNLANYPVAEGYLSGSTPIVTKSKIA